MRRLCTLLLVACAGGAESDPPHTDAAVDTDHGILEGPARLVFPPEAEDLDPDPAVLRVRLVAEPHTFFIGGEEVQGYAYNGSVPGPTLRAKVGDTIIAEIVNGLDVPTTVHWHGAQPPYAMDGVTWTEAPIAPGETFIATFTARGPRTAWYDPHFDTARQVDLGLYGALVITDPDEPEVDHDVVVIADSWAEHGARMPEEGENHHGVDGADIRWSFNGVVDPQWEVPAGDSVRMRWINASNTGYLDLAPSDGLRFIAGDQGLWPAPREQSLMGPGDRTEAEIRVGDGDTSVVTRAYSLYGGTVAGGEEVGRIDVVGTPDGARPDPVDWTFSPSSTLPDPGRTDLRFVLQGDAARSFWTINGETFPDVTVPFVPIGQDTVVEVRNLSPTEHPFHMHGHAFEVLSIDGVEVPGHPVEDTVNVGVRETLRLRFLADNPGFWMTHCHILPHAEGGMMTVVEVR